MRFLVTVLMTVVLSLGCSSKKTAVQKTDSSGENEVKADDFTLSWKIDGEKINIKVSAPTTSWIAVGFEPSSMMKDANIIIGYVKDGKAYIEDHYGTGNVKHEADINIGGKENVENASGKEENGKTELSFTIPLDSGDAKDKVLTKGKQIKVILACGKDGAKDFNSMHKKRTSVNISL
ncbi:MAG: DOMON domain-containing protein [Candidatus Coatesbacteria bacterium]|nr:DOMON domain-containing protein [Candidatus Coatesbacteria bacterium]